ncbi:MAG: DUF853 domain-containing protein [Lachnospiraceae bacterium]|nr:DUF853 domain-containing protein [Lachnospiraceae bacterium]
MFYEDKIWIGNAGDRKISILPKMANRHGLIAGATGTGKTTSLKVLAESFSDAGVPVFLADIKGDLSGLCAPGEDNDDMRDRIRKFALDEAGFSYTDYPTVFWDIYCKDGIPLRTTVSEMGPILLAKLMNLNDTQADILTCLFKMADDEDLLLVDIKDLKSMLQYASDNASEISKSYGNVTKQSVAAIIRGVVALEASGGDKFFTEPAFNIDDFIRKDRDGRGVINVLDGSMLASDPKLYTAFLLYLLSELFESLPEIGDPDRPKMIFFFDEAHLLFDDISKALRQKIEQIVKLIRSKGVGIYFCTQNPRDIPDEVLAQLGNKIQHALHAYTPSEERAVKTAADSFRTNPEFDTKTAIMELGVGEALISVLDEEGIPTIVERCKVLPPQSYMGPVSEREKEKSYIDSSLYKKYKDAIETDSAYEFLERLKSQQEEKEEAEKKAAAEAKEAAKAEKEAEKEKERERKAAEREEAARKRKVKSAAGSIASSAAGTVGREVGKSIGGKVGGSFGKTLGGNILAQLGRSIMGTFFK